MIPATEIIISLIVYESSKLIDFKMFGSVSKSMLNRAYRLIQKRLINRLAGRFEYIRHDGSSEVIITRPSQESPMSCSCVVFLDKAMCHHLVAATVIDKVSLPGVKTKVSFSLSICLFNPLALNDFSM